MATRKEVKNLTYANHPSLTARTTRIQIRGQIIKGYYLPDRSRALYDVPAELVEDFENSYHFQHGQLVAYEPDETPEQKTRRKSQSKSKTEDVSDAPEKDKE